MRNRLAFLLACSISSAYAAESKLHEVWYQPASRSANPEEIAKSYLNQQAKELGLSISSLKLLRQQDSLLANHFIYQQYLNQKAIHGATIAISVSKKDAAVVQSYSTLIRNPNAPTLEATISEEQAYEAAWTYISAQQKLFQAPKAKLQYVPINRVLTLVYSVELSPTDPYGAWRIDVDANSAAIVGVKDLRINERPVSLPPVFGSKRPAGNRQEAFDPWLNQTATLDTPSEIRAGGAQVFDPDPATELGLATLSDTSLASAFEKAYVQRILPEVNFSLATYSLKGPWVQIIDFDPPTAAPATSKDGNWKFTRGQEGFTDAMTYFHIDQSQRYMQSLGFKDSRGIQFRSIEADADGANGEDNSYFMASTNRLAFGHGCVDDNEDADVILHEYGHAIQFSINPEWGGGDTGAMGEGIGDYWAASYSYSTPKGHDFQPDKVYNWDSGACWPGRVLNATASHYDKTQTYGAHVTLDDGHQSDEIWSTPLFQAHKALIALGVPRSEIDTIVLEAQFGLGAELTMPDLAKAIVTTAGRLYAGPHAEIFRQKFIEQGILEAPKPVLNAVMATVKDSGGDGIVDPGESILLGFKIQNIGDLKAEGVTATVTSSDIYIHGFQAEFPIGDIEAGGSDAIELNFNLGTETPCGHSIEFQVSLKTKDGKEWALPFPIPVGKALLSSQSSAPKLGIPDKDTKGIIDTLVVNSSAKVSDRLVVAMNITHPYLADIKVSLTSPEGKTIVLHNRSGFNSANLVGSYPATLTAFDSLSGLVGQKLGGTWTLAVQDLSTGDIGTLNSWGIQDISGFECHGPTP